MEHSPYKIIVIEMAMTMATSLPSYVTGKGGVKQGSGSASGIHSGDFDSLSLPSQINIAKLNLFLYILVSFTLLIHIVPFTFFDSISI